AMIAAATFVIVQTSGLPALWLLAPGAVVGWAVQCVLFDIVKEQFFTEHGLRYASSKAAHADERPIRAKRGVQSWLFDLYWQAAGPLIRPAHVAGRRGIDPAAMRVW